MTLNQVTPYIPDWPTPMQGARRQADPACAPDPGSRSQSHAHGLRPGDAVPISPVEARNPSAPRRWAVVMAQGPRRLVEARGFRIESGAVVFAEPAGCVAAFAAGTWVMIEEDRTNA